MTGASLITMLLEDDEDDFSVKSSAHAQFEFVPGHVPGRNIKVYARSPNGPLFLGWVHRIGRRFYATTKDSLRQHCDCEKMFDIEVQAAEYLLEINMKHS